MLTFTCGFIATHLWECYHQGATVSCFARVLSSFSSGISAPCAINSTHDHYYHNLKLLRYKRVYSTARFLENLNLRITMNVVSLHLLTFILMFQFIIIVQWYFYFSEIQDFKYLFFTCDSHWYYLREIRVSTSFFSIIVIILLWQTKFFHADDKTNILPLYIYYIKKCLEKGNSSVSNIYSTIWKMLYCWMNKGCMIVEDITCMHVSECRLRMTVSNERSSEIKGRKMIVCKLQNSLTAEDSVKGRIKKEEWRIEATSFKFLWNHNYNFIIKWIPFPFNLSLHIFKILYTTQQYFLIIFS